MQGSAACSLGKFSSRGQKNPALLGSRQGLPPRCKDMTEAHDLELQQVLNLLQRMQHAFHTLLLGAETECTNADVKIAFGLLAARHSRDAFDHSIH